MSRVAAHRDCSASINRRKAFSPACARPALPAVHSMSKLSDAVTAAGCRKFGGRWNMGRNATPASATGASRTSKAVRNLHTGSFGSSQLIMVPRGMVGADARVVAPPSASASTHTMAAAGKGRA